MSYRGHLRKPRKKGRGRLPSFPPGPPVPIGCFLLSPVNQPIPFEKLLTGNSTSWQENDSPLTLSNIFSFIATKNQVLAARRSRFVFPAVRLELFLFPNFTQNFFFFVVGLSRKQNSPNNPPHKPDCATQCPHPVLAFTYMLPTTSSGFSRATSRFFAPPRYSKAFIFNDGS